MSSSEPGSTTDRWTTAADIDTRDTGLGIFVVDLPTDALIDGTLLEFTLYWPEAERWERTNFKVQITKPNV